MHISSIAKIMSSLGLTVALAVWCAPAQATAYTWQDGNSAWETTTNWTPTAPTGGPSGTTNTATINTANTTVQLNSSPTKLGTLTLGGTDTLNINSTRTFSATTINLGGGSITGPGTVAGSGITGTGTVSSAVSGATNFTANGGTMNANATGATTGTLNAANASILNVGAFTDSGGGTTNTSGVVNFNGTTLVGLTGLFSATTLGGTGSYNVTGTSMMENNFSFSNLSTMTVMNGSTLQLNAADYANPRGNQVTGGGKITLQSGTTLNNYSGNSAADTSITMNNAAITNTSGTGGTFNISGGISGTGAISGVTNHDSAGGITASGGLLTVIGIPGVGTGLGVTAGAGDSLNTAGVGNTLDLKGNFNLLNPLSINPNGGVIQFDGVNILNPNPWNFTLGGGAINVIANSSLAQGAVGSGHTTTSAATIGIASGVTLAVSGNFTNSGLLDFIIGGALPGQTGVFDFTNGSGSIGGKAMFDLTSFTPAAGEAWEFFTDSPAWAVLNSDVTVVGLAPGLTWEIDAVQGGEIFKIDGPTPTPEPATLMLMGFGLAGAALMRRRQMKSA